MKALFEILKEARSTNCSFCNKKCKTKRDCLIGQIMNEINAERVGTKYIPIKYMAVRMKVEHVSEADLIYQLSICKDYKNRSGSFSKCFWGCLKIKK